VVAPEQAVHGSTVEVRYRVTNRGAATTLGDSASINSWTDTVWLSVDPRRPSPAKGDVRIGQVTHNGHLAVGDNYLGTLNVQIPEGVRSGQYYITVWSDTYDAILEDTMAVYINPDDPGQIDNNNYKARPISVLGVVPPDLVVSQVQAMPAMTAAGDYAFSYTVQNRGDLFEGRWTDRVWIADNADLKKANVRWLLGEYAQQRSLNNGESYTVTQTVPLAPAVQGGWLVVETDREVPGEAARFEVAEFDETNNVRAAVSAVGNRPADLRVTAVQTEPENYSGEEATITWTVTNVGDDVWSGTQGWIDSVYFSPDPEFIPLRATALGAVMHSNAGGLAAGASYTASARVKLPPGTDGLYYIHVITDSAHHPNTAAVRRSLRHGRAAARRATQRTGPRRLLPPYGVRRCAQRQQPRARHAERHLPRARSADRHDRRVEPEPVFRRGDHGHLDGHEPWRARNARARLVRRRVPLARCGAR
jgi:hypothetical protein